LLYHLLSAIEKDINILRAYFVVVLVINRFYLPYLRSMRQNKVMKLNRERLRTENKTHDLLEGTHFPSNFQKNYHRIFF